MRILAGVVIGYALLTAVTFVWLAGQPEGYALALAVLLGLNGLALLLGLLGWTTSRTLSLALLLLAIASSVFAILLLGLEGILTLHPG
jgi:hypothetical protein